MMAQDSVVHKSGALRPVDAACIQAVERTGHVVDLDGRVLGGCDVAIAVRGVMRRKGSFENRRRVASTLHVSPTIQSIVEKIVLT